MRWMLAVLIVMSVVTAARAAPRRVAVLELEGPNARKIRSELVKLVKRSHSVVPLESWKRTAKSLAATKVTVANVKKVARKLRVDAVVEGTIDERRDGFHVRIRLRSGTTGRPVDELVVTTKGTLSEKAAQRDLRSELVDVIDTLDEDEPPRRRTAR